MNVSYILPDWLCMNPFRRKSTWLQLLRASNYTERWIHWWYKILRTTPPQRSSAYQKPIEMHILANFPETWRSQNARYSIKFEAWKWGRSIPARFDNYPPMVARRPALAGCADIAPRYHVVCSKGYSKLFKNTNDGGVDYYDAQALPDRSSQTWNNHTTAAGIGFSYTTSYLAI